MYRMAGNIGGHLANYKFLANFFHCTVFYSARVRKVNR